MNKQKHTVIIGISGGSASGKSTLCEILKQRMAHLKVISFCADTYYKRGEMPQMVSPVTGISDDDWNTPDALYSDCMIRDIETAAKTNEHDIIIVEGAFIFCIDKLRDMLDFKIFIDLDSDIRMYRRIKRNMAVRGLSLEEIADYFTEYAKFSEQRYSLPSKIYADVILNGVNFDSDSKVIDMLVLYLCSLIKT